MLPPLPKFIEISTFEGSCVCVTQVVALIYRQRTLEVGVLLLYHATSGQMRAENKSIVHLSMQHPFQ